MLQIFDSNIVNSAASNDILSKYKLKQKKVLYWIFGLETVFISTYSGCTAVLRLLIH